MDTAGETCNVGDVVVLGFLFVVYARVSVWARSVKALANVCSVCVACWCHGSILAGAQPVVVYLLREATELWTGV